MRSILAGLAFGFSAVFVSPAYAQEDEGPGGIELAFIIAEAAQWFHEEGGPAARSAAEALGFDGKFRAGRPNIPIFLTNATKEKIDYRAASEDCDYTSSSILPGEKVKIECEAGLDGIPVTASAPILSALFRS